MFSDQMTLLSPGGLVLAEEKEKKLDILAHELVPRHVLLNKKEAEKMLKQYRIEPYKLPYITSSDPVAVAIGATPGDIVKIVRKSPTASEAVAYRYVIEG